MKKLISVFVLLTSMSALSATYFAVESNVEDYGMIKASCNGGSMKLGIFSGGSLDSFNCKDSEPLHVYDSEDELAAIIYEVKTCNRTRVSASGNSKSIKIATSCW